MTIALKIAAATRNHQAVKHARGFTLVEMLVAVAVLLVLMSGLTMLFSGSVKTVRTASLQSDAIDRANGAIASLKSDILVSFNGRDLGSNFSFYGTPIGMTFIGRVMNRSENSENPDVASLQNTDLRVARITYVLYHGPVQNALNDWYYDTETFPQAVEGATAYSHRLLRYVEPNVADLDTFPFPLSDDEGPGLGSIIQAEWDDFVNEHPGVYSPEYEQRFKQAFKCEMWLRMLAGGDSQLPNAWSAPGLYLGRQDGDDIDVSMFVLTDHVATFMPPVGENSYETQPFGGLALFDYNYARPDLSVVAPNPWWNDWRSVNCWGSDAFCMDTGLPEIVSFTFWLMFDGPYANAANYQRQFTTQINVPAGLKRQPTISGRVFESDRVTARPGAIITPSSDLGMIIRTDDTGYYCASVPYGWTGRMQSDVSGEIKVYTNVTTNITGQDYAVQ